MSKHVHVIDRKTARDNGLTRYFTAKPCKHGHTEERNTYSGMCLGCSREIDRARYRDDPAPKLRQRKKYAASNSESIRERKRKYHDLQRSRNNSGPTVERKTCSTCDAEKDASQFHTHRAMPSGLSFECIGCAKERRDKRIQEDPDFYKRDYVKNRESHRRSRLRYRERNREKVIQQCRDWRAANPEKYLASVHARRARMLGSEGAHTAGEVRRIRKMQRDRCATCSISLSDAGCHIDHIVPISKGGTNWASNLQMLCPRCNLKKSAKDPIEWANENGKLL